jgi:hypothetical protein
VVNANVFFQRIAEDLQKNKTLTAGYFKNLQKTIEIQRVKPLLEI